MSQLNDDRTMHLLRIAASDLPRPMEDLQERLRAPGSAEWLENELERVLLPEGVLPASLRSGGVDLAALRRAKTRAVRLATNSLNGRDRMAALVAHDFVVAAALLHHRTLISERPREHWDDRLIELAVSTPEPWRTFLRLAADAEE
jgi:hypothetical protein